MWNLSDLLHAEKREPEALVAAAVSMTAGVEQAFCLHLASKRVAESSEPVHQAGPRLRKLDAVRSISIREHRLEQRLLRRGQRRVRGVREV